MRLSSATLAGLTPLARQDVAVAHLRFMSWKIKSERLATRWAESAWRYLDGQTVFHSNKKRDNRGRSQSTVTEVLRGLLKMFSVNDNRQYIRARDSFDFTGFRPTKREEVEILGTGRLVGTPFSRHQLSQAFDTLERAGILERHHNAAGRGKGIQLWLRLRTDRLYAAMDLLSTANRKDALPDPAKINPLLRKRASEGTQKAVAKNGNKTDVAEAVTMPVDRSSLIIKGQPSSGVVVSDSTFHCSVEQVSGGGSFWRATEAKGSDIASDTSILQFSESAQHNPDDVMTSIPEDYGCPALIELLNFVMSSFPVNFTWRHARLVTRHFNADSPRRQMTVENLTDYLNYAVDSSKWYYHVDFEELLRIWPVVLKHHTRDVQTACHGMANATEMALGSVQSAVDNETREAVERHVEGVLACEFGSGRPLALGNISMEGDLATYAFLTAFRLNRPNLAGEIAVGRRDVMVAAFRADPAWALAIRKLFPTIDAFLDLGQDVWDGFAHKAHVIFQDNMVRAQVANDLGVPQDKYTRLTPHVGEFIQ